MGVCFSLYRNHLTVRVPVLMSEYIYFVESNCVGPFRDEP